MTRQQSFPGFPKSIPDFFNEYLDTNYPDLEARPDYHELQDEMTNAVPQSLLPSINHILSIWMRSVWRRWATTRNIRGQLEKGVNGGTDRKVAVVETQLAFDDLHSLLVGDLVRARRDESAVRKRLHAWALVHPDEIATEAEEDRIFNELRDEAGLG